MDSSTYHTWLPSHDFLTADSKPEVPMLDILGDPARRLRGRSGSAKVMKHDETLKFLVKDGDFEWGFKWRSW